MHKEFDEKEKEIKHRTSDDGEEKTAKVVALAESWRSFAPLAALHFYAGSLLAVKFSE